MTAAIITAGSAPPVFEASLLSRFEPLPPDASQTSKSRATPLADELSVQVVSGHHWLSGGDLIRPLLAELSSATRGQIVASEPRTGIHGVGHTPAEAISDLRLALAEHLEVLEASEPLSDELQVQLKVLRAHLRRH